ncbi:uncharacterized protein LOC62_06G008811 [Vanrija pseudolonga]|uniref:Uncharacterized protein n=1 Tax=Vanrija pseudolonga TaxID=143232 RepID=A0AAF0YEG5_9TREE|nr:hypothetical protein LOC62_06G008811 [Vanrija pseudolonga]
MGCTSSTPLNDEPPPGHFVLPANAVIEVLKVTQEEFFLSFMGALVEMLYEPTLWSFYFGIPAIQIYFVDDGSSPQVLIVFGREDGLWLPSADLVNSVPKLPSAISNTEMVAHITELWADLCASGGVLNVDRPARVVVTFTPHTELPTNVFARFTSTTGRAGMPAVTAAAGMSEWLRLLQTPGEGPMTAADEYLGSFKDQTGGGDATATLNIDLRELNTASIGKQTMADTVHLLRADPIVQFVQSLREILPGLVCSVWERWTEYMPNSTSVWVYGVFVDGNSFMAVSMPGDGGKPKAEGKEVLASAIDPLINLCREGPPGVGSPSRFIFKYSPKRTWKGERIELDLTWLPRHSSAEPFDKTLDDMYKWVEALMNDGEDAAMYFIHSTPSVRSRRGDITFNGNPSAPDSCKFDMSDSFANWFAATPRDQIQRSSRPQAVVEATPQQVDSDTQGAPPSIGSQARQADSITALLGAIPELLYEPSLWTRSSLGLNLAIIYLVDDGSSVDSPQVLVAFRQKGGVFSTPAQLAKSQALPANISDARLVSRIKTEWTGLCASGVVGVDRPALVVLMYSPDVKAPDNNVTAVIGHTPARAGMPALSAAAGMADFLAMLQTPGQGLEAAWQWLSKFHDTPGDFGPAFQMHTPLRLIDMAGDVGDERVVGVTVRKP